MNQPPLAGHSNWVKKATSPALVFALSLSLGALVRASYFNATFALDEVYFLEDIGLVRNGRLEFTSYLLTLNGGYLHLLAKLQFYALWYCFGLNPDVHQMTIALAHAISATCVFLLVRHYLARGPSHDAESVVTASSIEASKSDLSTSASLGAWVASLMWASLAVGGYDNTFLLIGSGEQAVSIMWLTLAMCFVTQCHTHPIKSSIGMIFCATCSSLTWGLGLSMAPALLVQYYVLEFPSRSPHESRWKWLLMWAGVVGVISALHIALRAMVQEPSSAGELTWNMPWRFLVQYAVSLGNLIGFSHAQAGNAIALKLALALGLLAVAVFKCTNSRRLLSVFLVATVGYVATLVIFRADRDLFDGRYLFVPSLLWCVSCGIILAGLYDSFGTWGRKSLVACVALAAFFFVYHQRAVAGAARAQFDEYLTVTAETLDGYSSLIERLEEHAERSGEVVRLPDFPIVVPPNFFPTYFPFSAWVAVSRKSPPVGIELVQADKMTPAEIEEAAVFLDGVGSLQSRQAAHALRTVVQDTRSLIWLSEFAKQNNTTISLPNFTFAYPELELSFPVSQCLSNAFQPSLPSLRVLSAGEAPSTDFLAQLEQLESTGNSEAATWVAMLRQLSDSPQPIPPR